MPSSSKVYIAGVGISPLPSGENSKKITAALVVASTKALLEAGVTYDDVTRGSRSKQCRYAPEAFKAFDADKGVEVDEVERNSLLASSFALVENKAISCLLTMEIEQSNAVAFVLVSEDFLWSHPYLKDSSALIKKVNSSQSKTSEQSQLDLCKIVWALRGWSGKQGTGQKGGKQQWAAFELSRADGNDIPKWKDIEHKQDGRDRLRHNPAKETKGVSRYDFDNVRARGKSKDKSSDWLQFEHKGSDRTALAKL